MIATDSKRFTCHLFTKSQFVNCANKRSAAYFKLEELVYVYIIFIQNRTVKKY